MSNKLIDKVKFFMGLDDYDDEETLEPEYEENLSTAVHTNTVKKNKIVNIHTTTQMKVVIYEPNDFEEAPLIVDNLKNRKPVIINLENLEHDLAKKIFDFLNGAVYALDGQIQKVSKGIFILAPNNIDISGNFKEELKNKGIFPWQK
ncbi:cell division inhibitor SepF [Caminicella sporogenes DSM 14501]|uniref:Cell division protein SepF n=1 Tax=Caminicella sporogenes DSM 14501 TaxID=1121266 RepID=A0A1M6LJN0_9FIRM|nr:cell division protein SepF [Caminicella sporogenes]RKD27853.1 cell division protein SepF [Caminicella sporogenes]SHJ71406.1 cell division inhibitor SepF [Caminicella sporogenes DSM 14501]